MVALIPFFNSCSAGYIKEEPTYQTYNRPVHPSNFMFGQTEAGIGAPEHRFISKTMVLGRDIIKVTNIKKGH